MSTSEKQLMKKLGILNKNLHICYKFFYLLYLKI